MANGNSSGVSQTEIDYFSHPSWGGASGVYPQGSPTAATLAPPGVYSGPRQSITHGPSGFSYLGQDAESAQFARITDQYNLQRLFTDESFGRFREGLGQQMGRVGQGFDEARGYLDTAGSSARRRALEREQQLSSEMEARTGGRSYAYDYMRRGLASDTTRTLADIEESLGAMYSGLALQRTGVETGILGNLAASYIQQADTYQSLLAQQFSLLGGYAPQHSPGNDYSGLYGLAESLAEAGGLYLGLSGGGGGGGGGGSSPTATGTGEPT